MLGHIYVPAVGINQRGVKAVVVVASWQFWAVNQNANCSKYAKIKVSFITAQKEKCPINCKKRLINFRRNYD